MVRVTFSPIWFYGIDTFFEIVGVIVLLSLALLSYKWYRFSNNKKYKWFSVSFSAIMLSLLFKLLTNAVVYRSLITSVGKPFNQQIFVAANQFLPLSFYASSALFIYRSLFLFGFFGLYLLMKKRRDWEFIFVSIFLILAASFYSFELFHFFHLTAALFMAMVCANYFSKMRKPNFVKNAVAFSFVLLFTSQLSFLFQFLTDNLYVVGQVLQLLAFLLFLMSFFVLWRK